MVTAQHIAALNNIEALASELLQAASGKRIFLFYAPMGAGKTTFIKELCKALGTSSTVTSPTFSIINEYSLDKGKIFHFDFYRIKNEQEAVDVGVDEYFESGHFCFVEWPEKILNLLPQDAVKVQIEIRGEERIFTFTL